MAKDRHRPGYYKEYAKRTGKKDRHRKGYYSKYNLAHPERLERIGIKIDESGRPYKEVTTVVTETRNALSVALEKREHVWHDEDLGDDDE